jgi:Flp pilus assembly protein TadG
MKKTLRATNLSRVRDQSGVTIILVAILMFVFLGIAALAVDLSNLYVVRNELQNAADAGALAGARFLYNDAGTLVNEGANQIAYDAAIANKALTLAGAIPVDVNWTAGQNSDANVDIQRGHWSFGTRTFTANASLLPVNLVSVSDEELDTYNPDYPFINAVRVVARRQGTKAASFFARVFGREGFEMSAEAVAYIGFTKDLGPGEADQPIAICSQSILFKDEDDNDVYQCNIGRMLNSGSNTATSNTGGWTNFSQPCVTANRSSLEPLICGSGNTDIISFGEGIGAVNGVQDITFRDLETCWETAADSKGDGIPDTIWQITLPVIDCPGNAVSNCAPMIGAVTVKVVWVQRDNPGYNQAPSEMSDPETGTDWPTNEDLDMLVQDLAPYFVGDGPSDTFPTFAAGTTVRDVFYGTTEDSGRIRWASFVRRFDLRNVGPGDTAPYATFKFKSIYFLPSCEPEEPRGTTGGRNYGLLARIPVLVQ